MSDQIQTWARTDSHMTFEDINGEQQSVDPAVPIHHFEDDSTSVQTVFGNRSLNSIHDDCLTTTIIDEEASVAAESVFETDSSEWEKVEENHVDSLSLIDELLSDGESVDVVGYNDVAVEDNDVETVTECNNSESIEDNKSKIDVGCLETPGSSLPELKANLCNANKIFDLFLERYSDKKDNGGLMRNVDVCDDSGEESYETEEEDSEYTDDEDSECSDEEDSECSDEEDSDCSDEEDSEEEEDLNEPGIQLIKIQQTPANIDRLVNTYAFLENEREKQIDADNHFDAFKTREKMHSILKVF